jgi:hypothetical protein
MRYVLVPLALILGTFAAAQDGRFEGTVSAKTAFNPGQHSTLLYTSKWPRERFDLDNSVHGKVAVIYNWDAGTRTVLVPAKKIYWVIDLDAKAKQLQAAVENSGYKPEPASIVVTPTSRSEKIAGHPCKYVTVGYEQAIDICVANDMGEFVADQEIDGARAMGGPQKRDTMYDDLGGRFPGGYFPLKIVSRADGPERVVWLVTAVNRTTVPDKAFTIPDGYTKVDPPSGS